jgi:hypothetical protein
MDERNEQIKQAVVEATELIQSGATAGHEIMQVFATSVAQRVPDVRIEELHSMVIAMLGEIQRNCERANKMKEYSMKFADPNRPNETVREMVERRWPIQRRWPEDCAARTRGRPHGGFRIRKRGPSQKCSQC